MAAAAASSGASGARGSPAKPASLLSRDMMSAARTALAEGCAPGMAIAVAQGGTMLVDAGIGQANLETATPVSSRTIFRIGSLTKQFTAAAALKLAAQGKLDLDAPAERILPAFKGQPPFSLREAMHHTAGLHSDEEGGPLPDDGSLTQVRIAESIARQPKLFDFPPGTAWLYSNANYLVLGASVEAAAKMPFDAAIEDLLLRPLGLAETSVDRSSEVVARRANGYSAGDEAGRWFNAGQMDVWQTGGAGSMRSTGRDLARWHRLLLSGYVVGLPALIEPGRLRDGRLSGDNRFSPDDAHYGDVQYASGLLVSTAPNHPRIVQHYGFVSGFSALLETDIDRMRTLVVLLNADPGPKMPFRALRKLAFG